MREQHANLVTILEAAGALDDDAGEIYFLRIAGTLKRHGLLGPGSQWMFVVEFDSVFADTNFFR